MIEVKLLGPKDDQWAVINLGSQWLATTRAVYADAVKDAIAEAIANNNPRGSSAAERPTNNREVCGSSPQLGDSNAAQGHR